MLCLRENLALANIYIKDPAVTLIKRDQKIPVIWFVANVGGILGLCMGCSLVTLFEVLHHVCLIFLMTGKKSVSKLQKTLNQVHTPLVLGHQGGPGQSGFVSRQLMTTDFAIHALRTYNYTNGGTNAENNATEQELEGIVPPELAELNPAPHKERRTSF